MADLDTDAIRADMDEPLSVLGYRRRLQDALAEIDALRAELAALRAENVCMKPHAGDPDACDDCGYPGGATTPAAEADR